MKRRKLNINRVCYAISITIVIVMAALYTAAHAILKESEYEYPQMQRVNIGFCLNKVDFTYETKKSLENGDIDINDIYVVFSKDKNGNFNFIGIEGSDKIDVVETHKNRDGSVTHIIGFK